MLRDALYYEQLKNQDVRCVLCPHNCRLHCAGRGKCGVRRNVDGRLIAENYGLISAIHVDPIEKKPLYHFYPGRHILSLGSVGCNLKCNFCQNHEVALTTVDEYHLGQFCEAHEIVKLAKEWKGNIGMAFTYNEPTVYFEFMLEVAKGIKDEGMLNVMVSNGFINTEPLLEILPYIDAFNIDLKSFDDQFYKDVTKSRLQPVLEALKVIGKSGKHLELTYLLIPGKNDNLRSFEKMLDWVREELGENTVLHISRYHPAYKSNIRKTPLDLLFEFCEVARKSLSYVYLGNVEASDSQNTICNTCGKIVISRNGYFVQRNGIDHQGNCIHCKNHIVQS